MVCLSSEQLKIETKINVICNHSARSLSRMDTLHFDMILHLREYGLRFSWTRYRSYSSNHRDQVEESLRSGKEIRKRAVISPHSSNS